MEQTTETARRSFSGIFPHLAVTNDGRMESGIGAVVPWAGSLWFMTYTAHAPSGSQDKLYRLDPDGRCQVVENSVGGTHANRMIHVESGQLSIGPYLIDQQGEVRALPLERMPGRITASMRHIEEPERKIYLFCMEGELYEVDVRTLAWRRLFGRHPVAGSHAKGGYTVDGRIVVSNNGEWGWYDHWREDHAYDGPAGALAEWDGRDWTLLQRRQFTEIMCPGGLSGKAEPGQPLWALGWDKTSVLLNVRRDGAWQTLRLPKGSYTHDGGHGWHTEWPRIRPLEGTGRWLMTMHGMLYEFPPDFSAEHRAGLCPVANFHKMIVDFCQWRDEIVLACNDASMFDNPLLGRCQSNLWWTTLDELHEMGAPCGWGGVWLDEDLPADALSEPFLTHGFARQTLHMRCEGECEFELQVDSGDGRWQALGRFRLNDGYGAQVFDHADAIQWSRLRCIGGARRVTAYWHLSNVRPCGYYRRHATMFEALPPAKAEQEVAEAIIRPLSGADMSLQYVGYPREGGRLHRLQYRVDGDMAFEAVEDAALLRHFEQALGGRSETADFEMDEASVRVREGGQVFRLPRGLDAYDRRWACGHPRGRREVVTERSLWNIRGTFYELPRESSGGVRRMRPICTHNRLITDYCSWRGMLALAGHDPEAAEDDHFVRSIDGRAGLWLGTVDDLWKLGKPRGQGGPWRDTPVQADAPSDPYLMTGFDEKTLTLSHDSPLTVRFTLEVDFLGDGSWSKLETLDVAAGQRRQYAFATGFSAHWARLRAGHNCTATAWFDYR